MHTVQWQRASRQLSNIRHVRNLELSADYPWPVITEHTAFSHIPPQLAIKRKHWAMMSLTLYITKACVRSPTSTWHASIFNGLPVNAGTRQLVNAIHVLIQVFTTVSAATFFCQLGMVSCRYFGKHPSTTAQNRHTSPNTRHITFTQAQYDFIMPRHSKENALYAHDICYLYHVTGMKPVKRHTSFWYMWSVQQHFRQCSLQLQLFPKQAYPCL